MGGLKKEIRRRILESLTFERQMPDEELAELIDEEILNFSGGGLRLQERLLLQKELFDSFRRLDILQELLDDKSVTEIMINGAGKIFIEQDGSVRLWERRFEKPEQLEDIIYVNGLFYRKNLKCLKLKLLLFVAGCYFHVKKLLEKILCIWEMCYFMR